MIWDNLLVIPTKKMVVRRGRKLKRDELNNTHEAIGEELEQNDAGDRRTRSQIKL